MVRCLRRTLFQETGVPPSQKGQILRVLWERHRIAYRTGHNDDQVRNRSSWKKISQRAIGDPLDSSICSVPTYDNSEEEDSWTQPE